MNINRPKKVEILLVEGTAQGLRYFDIRNHSCRMFVVPRASFKLAMTRPEVQKAGVYILFSPSALDQGAPDEVEGYELPSIYVGEADVLLSRLTGHQRGRTGWTELTFFIAQDESLDKAKVRYLESRLVDRFAKDQLTNLENAVTPSSKVISEADTAVMDEFLDDMLFLLATAGYRLTYDSAEVQGSTPLLYIKRKDLQATGRLTDQGFVILMRSQVYLREVPSYGSSNTAKRRDLIKKGVLRQDGDHYIFIQDYPFSSPSLAASIVLGMSANGRDQWKDTDGRTLKELQEQGLI